MKTLRLTRAEAAAYSTGERRFWRVCKQQPEVYKASAPFAYWRDKKADMWRNENQYTRDFSPYGQPGDRIEMIAPGPWAALATITSITVEQRDGKWGWVVEVER